MTRLTVAGTPDAVATATTEKTRLAGSNTDVRYVVQVPGQTFRVFQQETGANRITGLADANGAPLPNDKVTADDAGNLPAFQLPDGMLVDAVWLDPDDDSTARFIVPVRFGPASATALITGSTSFDGGVDF